MGGKVVMMGAMCQCQFSFPPKIPLPIAGTAATVLSMNRPTATILDLPMGTFGGCTSMGNPTTVAAKIVGAPAGVCAPAFIPPWTNMPAPGIPPMPIKTFFMNKPVLMSNYKLACALSLPPIPPCISVLPVTAAMTINVN